MVEVGLGIDSRWQCGGIAVSKNLDGEWSTMIGVIAKIMSLRPEDACIYVSTDTSVDQVCQKHIGNV